MKSVLCRLLAPLFALLCPLLGLSWSAQCGERILHPFLAAQPKNAPEEAVLTVEIPAGSFTKYEINEDGLVFVDRFQSMPVTYPANYGSMPRTLAGDGDPLDALVLTREPLHPGVLIKFRPIGVLRMTDDGEGDQKIIGVPTDKIDPTYAGIRDLGDLPAIEQQRIEAFFRVYKDLPAGRNPVKLDGFGDAAEARALIEASMRRFELRQKNKQVEDATG
jgi:inorganic pyrophosphatase